VGAKQVNLDHQFYSLPRNKLIRPIYISFTSTWELRRIYGTGYSLDLPCLSSRGLGLAGTTPLVLPWPAGNRTRKLPSLPNSQSSAMFFLPNFYGSTNSSFLFCIFNSCTLELGKILARLKYCSKHLNSLFHLASKHS
jgi:hypothetical protein